MTILKNNGNIIVGKIIYVSVHFLLEESINQLSFIIYISHQIDINFTTLKNK